jgi:four helix bundle protein
MKIEQFEDIMAWQKAKELTIKLYQIFETSKDFGFRDQILRASLSIMNNIAEGFERRSDKELRHFLYISKGSCAEVRSMLLLSVDLDKISSTQANSLIDLNLEISKLLSGFIKSINH